MRVLVLHVSSPLTRYFVVYGQSLFCSYSRKRRKCHSKLYTSG